VRCQWLALLSQSRNPGGMLSQRSSGVFEKDDTTEVRHLTTDDIDFQQLSKVISNERLTPYLLATHEDKRAALRLYKWNVRASGAVFELLAILEVVLRNSLNQQLASYSLPHPAWFENPSIELSRRAQMDIENALRRLDMRKGDVRPSRVITELPFGFWKYLLSKRYEATLWTQCLRHAFPRLHPQRRSLVFASVHESHFLRNRIAHHEPIFRRDLLQDSERIFSVLEWIEPTCAQWARSLNRVELIWSQRNH
jgi:hypothetical protein